MATADPTASLEELSVLCVSAGLAVIVNSFQRSRRHS